MSTLRRSTRLAEKKEPPQGTVGEAAREAKAEKKGGKKGGKKEKGSVEMALVTVTEEVVVIVEQKEEKEDECTICMEHMSAKASNL